ncbi:MAG: hypothetical protein WA152_04865 [Microgenomates group bacterium]
MMLKKALSRYLTNSWPIALILLGSLSWSMTMVKSGLRYPFGIGFWGANGYDGVWHIALINNLSKFIFENPVLAGEQIKNYHIGFDLFLATIHRITSIPVSVLYFQIFPPVAAVLIGWLTYVFVNNWTKNKKSALLATFFTYFGGSVAWIIGMGESTFWSHQSMSTLINPPYALSLIFILLGLVSLQKDKLLLSIISFGLLIQIKAYAAILILGGLFVASIYEFYKNNSFAFAKVFMGSLVINLILFSLVKNDSLSVFSFYPFWFLETLFAARDRLSWPKMAEAMLSYKTQSVVVKYLLAYGLAGLIFVVGNFWTRLIFLKDIFKKIDGYKLMFLSMIAFGLFMPTFFVQIGTPWNTIQFLYYSLFFSGILAGITVSNIKNNVLIVVVLITLPTSLIGIKSTFITNTPPAAITNEEIESLNFLRSQKYGTVLSYPFDTAVSFTQLPNKIPLYKYSNTAYLPAYTEKSIYFERTNVEIMGYDWENRRKNALIFFTATDLNWAKEFLESNNIKYLYLVKEMTPLQGELMKLGPADLGLSKIFENNVSIIYKYGEDFGSN